MSRSAMEVFESHKEAIDTLNFEQLAADYAEDAILLTLDGAHHGRDGILTGFFQAIFSQFSNPKIYFNKVVAEDDLVLLEWSAEADNASVPYGSAVFLIRDGMIQRQGEWFNVVPK